MIVTPNWNPGSATTGVYDTHPIGVFYRNWLERWCIFNQNDAPIPAGPPLRLYYLTAWSKLPWHLQMPGQRLVCLPELLPSLQEQEQAERFSIACRCAVAGICWHWLLCCEEGIPAHDEAQPPCSAGSAHGQPSDHRTPGGGGNRHADHRQEGLVEARGGTRPQAQPGVRADPPCALHRTL
jgi:hypothetical protein